MTHKTTLLMVTGLTPQVVTETLYALHQQNAMPTAIHILTTAEGYQRARLTLINDGWLMRFYSDYQLTPPKFTAENIHILQNAAGEPLNDIRTQADNQAMADGITEWVRVLTSDDEKALHVSIAGGRKTMGFYAGYALSLYGRPQDKLSHVLVSADYESHPQFYYPTPYSQVIYGNDPTRKPLDTQNAEVMLADIAFVRLRHGLDNALLQGKSSFSDSVSKAQQVLGLPFLKIDLKQRCIEARDQIIYLSPADLAFYSWIIHCQFTLSSSPVCPSDGLLEPDYAQQYLAQYCLIVGEMGGADRTINALKNGMGKSFFEQRKSRINKKITEHLQQAGMPFLITTVGDRPKRHQVLLQLEQIKLL
ncbi:conserved hypothetical protein [Crenothrix polyspora]|uniref:CRISPR system ring nuclease SSO2081-like domain-containing protein n=1 Tax=Crenothrix polyspora TaxID=360316 RepID=A0A1R4HBF4_9GAMM|nr:CRISPR-associated ring nuclease Csm6 [Crenothrix polyspora]SJM93506.1 conserved hypothetical protein [Crenothrix polyspora]